MLKVLSVAGPLVLVHLLEAVGTGTENPAPYIQLGSELEQPVKTPGKLFLLPIVFHQQTQLRWEFHCSQLIRICLDY